MTYHTLSPGDEVRIGNVLVRVIEIRAGQVRLGLTAPRAVEIWRAELLPKGLDDPPRAG